MLEWSKLIELTLVGRELGDDLKESPFLEKDPRYKRWKAEEACIHQWILSTMNLEIRRDFLCVDSVKELWDEVSKCKAKKHYDCRIYDLSAKVIQARQGSKNILMYSSKLKGILREIDYLWIIIGIIIEEES